MMTYLVFLGLSFATLGGFRAGYCTESFCKDRAGPRVTDAEEVSPEVTRSESWRDASEQLR